MNRTLIALFVIFAITSTQATKATDTTDITDTIQCTSDVFNLFPQIQSLVSDVQSSNIIGVLADVTSLLKAYPQVAKDCGLTQSKKLKDNKTCLQDIEEIVAIAQQISQNPTDIIQDLTQLEALFQTLQNVQADCSSLSVLPSIASIASLSEEFLGENFF